MVIWLIGLSGSGKSTLANEIVTGANRGGSSTILLDGDVVREIFGNDLDYEANMIKFVISEYVDDFTPTYYRIYEKQILLHEFTESDLTSWSNTVIVSKYYNDYAKYFGITKKKLLKYLEKIRNKEIFIKKNNKWILDE